MQFTNIREYIEKVNQVYHAVLAGPLLFFAYLFFTRSKNDWKGILINDELNSGILFVVMPVLLTASIWAYRNYKSTVKGIDQNKTLKDKLNEFSGIFFTFQIWIGLAGFAALICLYITGKILFLALYISSIFFISFHRPSPLFIAKSLRLKDTEREAVLKREDF